MIAPFNGSNVMKLENTALDIDILRNDLSLSPAELKAAAEVYGMPTLYLPNRLSHGNLKTSDAMYHFLVTIHSETIFTVSFTNAAIQLMTCM